MTNGKKWVKTFDGIISARMSPDNTSNNKTKICPTCGTRLSDNAARCLVCGTEFAPRPEPKVVRKAERSVQASRMPEVTLTLPAAVGILAVVIVVAVVIVFFALRSGDPTGLPNSGETATPSETPT